MGFPPLEVTGIIPHVSSADTGMTFSACVNQTAGSTGDVFSNMKTDILMGGGFCLKLSSDMQHAFRFTVHYNSHGSGTGFTAYSDSLENQGTAFTNDEHHRIVVTAKDGQIKFYLDGVPIGTRIMPGGASIETCPGGSSPSFIGAENSYNFPDYGFPGHDERLTGSVEQTIIYSTALSPSEIADMPTCAESKGRVGSTDSDDS